VRRHRSRARVWLLSAGAIVLIAAHGVILYRFSSHAALTAAAVSGVIVLVAIKHLGLLGPTCALFRRRRGKAGEPRG